jgi:hypothetical protein
MLGIDLAKLTVLYVLPSNKRVISLFAPLYLKWYDGCRLPGMNGTGKIPVFINHTRYILSVL